MQEPTPPTTPSGIPLTSPPLSAETLASQLPKPPTTTQAEDAVVAGQRRVNMTWELTQSIIAVLLVVATVIVSINDGLNESDPSHPFPAVLANSLFLVLGFYFARSNHSAIGGIGAKATDSEKYVGR